MKYVLLHNPLCSKSRQAHQILCDHGIDLQVIEYLKQPLDLQSLQDLLKKLGDPAQALLRVKDAERLGLRLSTDDEILKAIAKDPRLMERPILVGSEKAVIGRPPEAVLRILPNAQTIKPAF